MGLLSEKGACLISARSVPRFAAPPLVALAGHVIVVGLSILLARRLSPSEFEAYAVAAAAFVVMVAAAPLGADKLALRVLPPLVADGRVAEFRVYIGFATRRCLIGSATAVAICLAAVMLFNVSGPTQKALLMSCLALPAAALAHLALETMTAAGRPAAGLVIVRVTVPSTVIVLASALGADVDTGAAAIGAWGCGWCLALGLAWWASPPDTPAVFPPGAPNASWQALSAPLWLHRLAIGAIAPAGILALEISGVPPVEVGAYAAAMSLIGFSTVLATATNRVYAERMSRAIASGDRLEIHRLRRHHVMWLTPLIATFVALTFLFTDTLLGLYRPEFVAVGRTALRLLALAAAVSILMAPAATLLKLVGSTPSLLRSTGVAALAHVVLLFGFVPSLGITGAAASYLAATIVLAALAQQESRRYFSRHG